MAVRPSSIHPTAVVDDGATIGLGTVVWHFSHVMAGARVGARCVLGQNVFVASGAVVGDGCKIQNNVSIYDGVVIEDEVFLGPSCVLTNVKNPRAAVSRRDAFVSTRLCHGCTIGANATIVCGVTVGRYALVGAGAVVSADVRAHALMFGVPATQHGWVGRRGVRLEADADGVLRCPESGEGYRLVDGALVSL